MADDTRRVDAVDALRVVDPPVIVLAADKRRDDVAEGGDVLLVVVFLIVDVVLVVEVGILDDEAVVVVVVMRDVARVPLAVDGFLDVVPCVLLAIVLGGEREMELLLLPEAAEAFDDVKVEVLLVFVASVMVYCKDVLKKGIRKKKKIDIQHTR